MHRSTLARTRWLGLSILIAAILTTAVPQAAHAQPPQSLKFVPEDAAFYSASLRLRDQYDAFVESNAFAKLKAMPIVQMGWGMFQQQWNNPEGGLFPVRMMLEQPENQQLVDVIKHDKNDPTTRVENDVDCSETTSNPSPVCLSKVADEETNLCFSNVRPEISP